MMPRPVPADMLCVHAPPESTGDCMRAALATLLALPSAEVPHLVVARQGWYRAALEFLRPLGLGLFWIDFPALEGRPLPFYVPPGTYTMLFGRNPKDLPHAVVGLVRDDLAIDIWHDPNPTRSGLVPGSLDGLCFLVPLPRDT